eukprot:10783461-Alexandrium_andersonii.AAC.1
MAFGAASQKQNEHREAAPIITQPYADRLVLQTALSKGSAQREDIAHFAKDIKHVASNDPFKRLSVRAENAEQCAALAAK